VHPWRQVLDEEGKCVVDRFGIDSVIVVEDDDKIALDDRDLVDRAVRTDSVVGG